MSRHKEGVIERNERFSKTLNPGVHFLIPFVNEIAFVHSFREIIVTIPRQHNVTNDSIFSSAALRTYDPDRKAPSARPKLEEKPEKPKH